MTYAEAMARFGSDKPDLRVSLELTELTDLAKTVDFKVFRNAADLPNGRVAALRVPGGGRHVAQGDRRLRALRRDLRREGSRVDQGQRRDQAQRGRPAVADRQVPVGARAARDPRAHRRAERRRRSSSAPTRRRSSTTRSARCASSSATSADSRPASGSRCGWSTSRCSSTTKSRRRGRRGTIRSPRPRTGTRSVSRRILRTRSPRPTTS